MNKDELFAVVDAEEDRLHEVARRLWENPEVALSEHESAGLLSAELEQEGFEVERGVGGLETAFVATFGTGPPTIGLLGEYDALPGLSQKVAAEREPVKAGEPGHGCGHNLHGVGALGAAFAAKRAIESGTLDGTVAYFGCPAEETLVGKVYMARAGAFDDLDAALAWHPADVSSVRLGSANALDSIRYVFEGESAHAAAAPESGRSALDAVQLLNTGVEYMREHVPDEARVHYVIDEGGEAPNVVPATASVSYFVRAPTREGVEQLASWLDDVADGAALMTQTEVRREFVTGCHPYLANETVGMEVWENMERVGAIEYTAEERAFATELQETISGAEFESRISRYPEQLREELRERAVYPEPVEPFDRGQRSAGTADLGEVCWIAPTVQFRGATWPVGTPAHTWQAVAANGEFGLRGVTFAAKVMAGTVYDLLADPSILDDARVEHQEATGGRGYESPVPEDAEVPAGD